jgi:hypothetical protein
MRGGDMTILRMDNVGIVVDDLKAASAFFVELGLELEGETRVEVRWADRVVGLDGVQVDVAMMRTPDGHSRLELMKFDRPMAASAEPKNAPPSSAGARPTRRSIRTAASRPPWRSGSARSAPRAPG